MYRVGLALITLLILLQGRSYAQDVTVTVGDSLMLVTAGQVLLPVDVSSLDEAGVGGYQFVLQYDAEIVDVTGISATGTISDGLFVQGNTPEPGRLNGVGAGADTLAGAGVLFFLELECKTEGSSNLDFSEFDFDQAGLTLNIIGGVVECAETIVDVDVSVDTIENVGRGEEALIPIRVAGLAGAPAAAFSFDVSIDSAIVSMDDVTLAGSLSDGGAVELSPHPAGGFRARVDLPAAVSTDGTLLFLNLRCDWIGTTDVVLSDFNFDTFNIAETVTSATATCFSRVDTEDPETPASAFHLEGSYPNPFLEQASIIITLDRPEPVTIRVFDVLGREVMHLWNAQLGAGRHQIPWHRGDLPGGLYLYQVQTSSDVQTGKALVSTR